MVDKMYLKRAQNTSGPFFSIIIPTYNRSELVTRAIESVIGSTFDDYEIIVVDDGSTDGTYKTIQDIGNSKVSYLFINNSGGPARPRNIGIRNAKGLWLCFLDSDDLFGPYKLERLYYHITMNRQVNIFYHKLTNLSSCGPVGQGFDFLSKTALYRLLSGNQIPLSGACLSKRFICESNIVFNENKMFSSVEDWDYWISAFIYGCRFMFIDEELGQYNDLVNDRISENFDHAINSRIVAKKYCNNLQPFQRLCVNQYWSFEVLRSQMKAYTKFSSITNKSTKWFIGFNINFLAALMRPFSIILILRDLLRILKTEPKN